MADDIVCTPRRRQPYFYIYDCHPKVTKYPLHSATYNGRTQTVQALLDNARHSVYQLACDVEDEQTNSVLFMAIARKHEAIAQLYLDIITTDLHAVEKYFFRHQEISTNRFWLNERILIAFGQDHIDYVLSESSGVLADPSEMGDRTGLLVLLKPNNNTVSGVVWLTNRECGADRTIARIIAHIYERGGELSVARKEWWKKSLFDVAAKMNLMQVWQRMHDLFGEILGRRESVASYRYIAEHEEIETDKTERFDKLCHQIGGFPVTDIFTNGDEPNILCDAVDQYDGDFAILHHLICIAASSKEESVVIDQIVNHRGCDRSLLSVAFQLEDKDLPWKLLQFSPDLISCCTEWWDTPVNRFIQQKPFDERVHALILKQLESIGRSDDFRWDLLRSLIYYNWADTVKEIYLLDPSYKDIFENTQNAKQQITLLESCAQRGAYEIIELLLSQHEFDSSMKSNIILNIKISGNVPQIMWTLLDKHQITFMDNIKELLCLSLKRRQLDLYRQLINYVPELHLTDNLNSKMENLLFAATWDTTQVRDIEYEYIVTESPEFIDSEDDVESSAHKSELNRQRTPPVNQWKGVSDENIELEQQYQQIFCDLLNAGVNWRQVNDHGQNLAHIAVERNNLFVLNLLIDLGVDLSLIDLNGNAPMHLVNSVEAFILLPVDDVRSLNKREENALLSYLHNTVYYRHDEELQIQLIHAGVDVNQVNCDGDTALHLVQSSQIIKQLIDAKANVNVQNAVGDTPSHCAFRLRDTNRTTSLQLLFGQPDHDVFIRNNSGESMLSEIVELNETDFEVVQALIGKEKLSDLLKLHCNYTAGNANSMFALTQRGDENLHCFKELLENINLDVRTDDKSAVMCHDDGRWLVECGAHINERADKTPLDWAQCIADGATYLNQLKMFVSAGMNTTLVNRIGETALQCYGSMYDEHRDAVLIMARLLEAGANYRLLTIDGVPVLHDTVFRSFYEWDDENNLGIQQQVFQPKFIF